MTLQQLTYLVTVAECGNITDAAERLFLSQPSLSAATVEMGKSVTINTPAVNRRRWALPPLCAQTRA